MGQEEKNGGRDNHWEATMVIQQELPRAVNPESSQEDATQPAKDAP